MTPLRASAVGAGLGAPLFLALIVGLDACGARTGLLAPPPDDDASTDASDAALRPDGTRPVDAGPDTPALIDAQPLRDVNVDLCRDAGATLVYAVTEANRLLRFDPTTSSFATIGTLACNDPNSAFSMAVDRNGIAYVLFAVYASGVQGNVYRVSLATSACLPTGFVAPIDFPSFGMGFSADDVGSGETLYVASDNATGGQLGALDTKTYGLTPLGFFDPPILGAELSGTGDGRLFAFYTEGGPTARGAVSIAQIDKATARVIATDPLPGVEQGNAWAFAFWGGDFYLFTAPASVPSGSIVQRFRPTDGSITQVAAYPERIVGAGVSTCAPAR